MNLIADKRKLALATQALIKTNVITAEHILGVTIALGEVLSAHTDKTVFVLVLTADEVRKLMKETE